MIGGFAILLAFQLAGEAFKTSLCLPVPGPVIGMALLLVGLGVAALAGITTPETIEKTDVGRLAGGLLGMLGVLFVPAGVGVIQQLDLLNAYGLALIAALVGSTVLTLIATVWAFVAADLPRTESVPPPRTTGVPVPRMLDVTRPVPVASNFSRSVPPVVTVVAPVYVLGSVSVRVPPVTVTVPEIVPDPPIVPPLTATGPVPVPEPAVLLTSSVPAVTVVPPV